MFKKITMNHADAKIVLKKDRLELTAGNTVFHYLLSENRKREIEAGILLTSDINQAAVDGYCHFTVPTNTRELLRYLSIRDTKINLLYMQDHDREKKLSMRKKMPVVLDDIAKYRPKKTDDNAEQGDNAEQYHPEEPLQDFDLAAQEILQEQAKRHEEKKLERKKEKEREDARMM
jgi:hypothetical protein